MKKTEGKKQVLSAILAVALIFFAISLKSLSMRAEGSGYDCGTECKPFEGFAGIPSGSIKAQETIDGDEGMLACVSGLIGDALGRAASTKVASVRNIISDGAF